MPFNGGTRLAEVLTILAVVGLDAAVERSASCVTLPSVSFFKGTLVVPEVVGCGTGANTIWLVQLFDSAGACSCSSSVTDTMSDIDLVLIGEAVACTTAFPDELPTIECSRRAEVLFRAGELFDWFEDSGAP